MASAPLYEAALWVPLHTEEFSAVAGSPPPAGGELVAARRFGTGEALRTDVEPPSPELDPPQSADLAGEALTALEAQAASQSPGRFTFQRQAEGSADSFAGNSR